MTRFLTIFALFCSIGLFAQPIHTERIEYSVDSDSAHLYNCLPFKTNGILLKTVGHNKQTGKKNEVITYTKYDTAFHKISSTNVTLPSKRTTRKNHTNNAMHFEMKYKNSGEYTISAIAAHDMSTYTIHGKMPKKTIVSYLRGIGDYVYILGYTKDLPTLLIQNIHTGEIEFGKIIPLKKKDFDFLSFEINEDTQEVYLFTQDEGKNERLVKFYVYKDGKKISEKIIKSPDSEKQIVSVFASQLKDGSYLISGTYGNGKKSSDTSTGIFIMNQTKNGGTKFFRFINYLDINNFTSYLSERKQEKIEKKIEKKESKNKEFEINYLMTPHNIIEQNGEYVLVGEAFYPTYVQRCDYYTDANGRQTMRCYNEFDGYEYTHYFMLGFDSEGQTLWSNSAPMDIANKPFTVVHFLSINQNNPYVRIVYSSGDSIFLHNYNAGKEVSNTTLSFTDENEKLLSSSSVTKSWYENTFISYGLQKIKDKEEREKRRIFFIEKIQF